MSNNITEKQQRPHHPKSFISLDDSEVSKVLLTFQGESPDLKVLEEELNKAGFYPKSIKSQKNK